MEEYILNDIVDTARKMGCRNIVGQYVPSAKNKLVLPLYFRLGFSKISEEAGTTTYELKINSELKPLETWVMTTQ